MIVKSTKINLFTPRLYAPRHASIVSNMDTELVPMRSYGASCVAIESTKINHMPEHEVPTTSYGLTSWLYTFKGVSL